MGERLCRMLDGVHVAFRFSTERLYKSAARQACGMRDRACRLAPYRNFSGARSRAVPNSFRGFLGGQSPWELELEASSLLGGPEAPGSWSCRVLHLLWETNGHPAMPWG